MSITANTVKGFRRCLLSVLVLAAASCSRETVPGGAEAERLPVSFVVSTTSTRAAVTPSEGRVSSLDVLVFRTADGVLEGYNRVTEPAPGRTLVDWITAEVSSRESLDWYVVANAPAGVLSAFTREDVFTQGLTLLTDGTETSLVMMGHGRLATGPVETAVPVSLDRYACKVTVREVAVEWPDAFALGAVAVGRTVLVNVVGSTPWSGVPAVSGVWHNAAGIDAQPSPYVADMTVKDWGGKPVTSSAPVDIESPLYCMPNPTVNNDNSANTAAWTARPTRVAVELLIGGVSNWYPVDLPAMYCNTHYLINRLTVTGPGSQGPDWPVERSDIRYTVNVLPWGETTLRPTYGD